MARWILAFTLVALLLGLVPPQPAYAWKPKTHAFLADLARLDAIDDGYVRFNQVDYHTGQVLPQVLGDFEVDPNIVMALQACQDQYRNGAVNADFYPDISVAQLLLHPDNSGAGSISPVDGISQDWIDALWNNLPAIPAGTTGVTCIKELAILAFVVGYTTHFAGDMYGHTFINYFAGGPWSVETLAQHMVVESVVDRRTPDNSAHFYDISDDMILDYFYNTLVNTDLIGHPDLSSLPNASLASLSLYDLMFPRLVNGYRRMVNGIGNAINAVVQAAAQDVQQARNALNRCGRYAFACKLSAGIKLGIKQAIHATLFALTLPLLAYINEWLQDIDDGQKAWIDIWHEVTETHLFHRFANPPSNYELDRKIDHFINYQIFL